jgi:hypothetical protein
MCSRQSLPRWRLSRRRGRHDQPRAARAGCLGPARSPYGAPAIPTAVWGARDSDRRPPPIPWPSRPWPSRPWPSRPWPSSVAEPVGHSPGEWYRVTAGAEPARYRSMSKFRRPGERGRRPAPPASSRAVARPAGQSLSTTPRASRRENRRRLAAAPARPSAPPARRPSPPCAELPRSARREAPAIPGPHGPAGRLAGGKRGNGHRTCPRHRHRPTAMLEPDAAEASPRTTGTAGE